MPYLNHNLNSLEATLTPYLKADGKSLFTELAGKADSGTWFDRMMFVSEAEKTSPFQTRMEPEDRVKLLGQLLNFCEDHARAGCPVAMRYTASMYSNGYQDRQVERKTDGGYIVRSNPDYKTAFNWASKAADAGDQVGAKIAASLKEQLGKPKL